MKKLLLGLAFLMSGCQTMSANNQYIASEEYEVKIGGTQYEMTVTQDEPIVTSIRYLSHEFSENMYHQKAEHEMWTQEEIERKQAMLDEEFPNGTFLLTVYGRSMEAAIGSHYKTMLIQDGEAVERAEFERVPEVPHRTRTNRWENKTILGSKSLDSTKPFEVRITTGAYAARYIYTPKTNSVE